MSQRVARIASRPRWTRPASRLPTRRSRRSRGDLPPPAAEDGPTGGTEVDRRSPPSTPTAAPTPTLAAEVLIGIFLLAAVLIWLGLGLSRRATASRKILRRRRRSRPSPAAALRATRSATPARPAGRRRAAVSRSLGTLTGRRTIDDEAWDELEEALLVADVGMPTTPGCSTSCGRGQGREWTTAERLVRLLRDEIVDDLSGGDVPRTSRRRADRVDVRRRERRREDDDDRQARPHTRSTGRRRCSRRPTRSAPQPPISSVTGAERTGADDRAGQEGADPGSVVFDAMERGAGRGADLVLVDTAGRLHTKVNLMERAQEAPPDRRAHRGRSRRCCS